MWQWVGSRAGIELGPNRNSCHRWRPKTQWLLLQPVALWNELSQPVSKWRSFKVAWIRYNIILTNWFSCHLRSFPLHEMPDVNRRLSFSFFLCPFGKCPVQYWRITKQIWALPWLIHVVQVQWTAQIFIKAAARNTRVAKHWRWTQRCCTSSTSYVHCKHWINFT
jgi:hypothetical protein